MPIKNKPFFVPKSFPYQPDGYTDFFGRVSAVFTHPTKGVTIYLEIDANTWQHESLFDASGNLHILYQAKDCRRNVVTNTFKTLNAALSSLKWMLENKNFGNTLKDPIKAEIHNWYLPKSEKTKRPRRKGNGKSFVLSEDDKTLLLSWGYPENELPQIEEAANRSTFTIIDADGNDLSVINVWEAIEILGRKTFLSGISRSAFHWTSSRESPDGKTSVYFDSSVLFR